MQDIYRLTSAEYHPTDAPTYRSETDGSFKHGPNMVHVESTPAHFNPNAPAGLSSAGITAVELQISRTAAGWHPLPNDPSGFDLAENRAWLAVALPSRDPD